MQFELTDQTRESLIAWLTHRGGGLQDYVFPSRSDGADHISTRQYVRLVRDRVTAGEGTDGGQDCQAYGSTLFMQGNQSVIVAAPSGTTLTFVRTIADESGSGGGTANPAPGRSWWDRR